MPDEIEDDVPTPIEVTPTTLPEQAFALMRQLTLILAGISAVLGFVKTRDIAALIDFLRSSQFIPALISAAGLAALIYGNLKMKWRKKELIVAAEAAPNTVAIVKPA